MQKVYFYTLISFLTLVSFSSATAQSKFEYQINSGFSNPVSPNNFDTNWNTGYNLGLGLNYSFNQAWQINTSFTFNRFGVDLKPSNSLGISIAREFGDAYNATFIAKYKKSCTI